MISAWKKTEAKRGYFNTKLMPEKYVQKITSLLQNAPEAEVEVKRLWERKNLLKRLGARKNMYAHLPKLSPLSFFPLEWSRLNADKYHEQPLVRRTWPNTTRLLFNLQINCPMVSDGVFRQIRLSEFNW